MKLHILNNYKTPKPVKFEGFLEIDELKAYLEEEAKFYSNLNRSGIEEEIYSFLSDRNDLENLDEPAINTPYGSPEYELEVLNIEEILEYFSYLLNEKECCKNQTGNYCSICGKKLK